RCYRTAKVEVSGEGWPGGVAGGPEVVEDDGVLVGVHAVPEALVAEGPQLAVGSESLQRLALEHAALVEMVEHSRLEAEEAAVDPVLAARLLDEALDGVAGADACDAPLQLRPHYRDGGGRAVRGVEIEQRVEVDVGDPVGIGRAEGFAVEPSAQPRKPPASRRVPAGVDAGDLEALRPGRLGDELLDH